MENGPRGNIIWNQDQTKKEDITIRSDGSDEKIEYKDTGQPEEVEEYQDNDAQIN